MRRAAANLLHRVVADGIGQPAALPAAFAPYYRDAAVVLRHSGIQQPALTDGANRPTVVVEHLRAQRGRRAIRQRDMGKPRIAGTRDKFDLHRRARIGHHRRAAGDNLHMVVQTLRIEIQPVSGKGIEVRDDRKTTAVNRLSKAVSHLAPTAPGASTMAKVSPSSGVAVMPP